MGIGQYICRLAGTQETSKSGDLTFVSNFRTRAFLNSGDDWTLPRCSPGTASPEDQSPRYRPDPNPAPGSPTEPGHEASNTSQTPDLKVLVQPADHSSIVASTGPSQFIPAAQLEQFKQELAALQSHVEQAVDEYKSSYPLQLKFDYSYKANEAPFDIQRHHPCRPRRPKLMVANAFSLT
jgi:hypothetical protein